MIYEIKGAIISLRKEGVAVFARKVWAYFHDLLFGLPLVWSKRPKFKNTAESVDYAIKAGRGVIRPGQVRSEIIELATLVKAAQPKLVVEIGTATGGTFFLWCANAAPDATVISIDLPNGIHGGGYPYWKTCLYRSFAQSQQRAILFRGDSHSSETLERLKQAIAGRPIDFLFIDGDHTYEGVKQDFEKYSPLVRPGGIIALHDVALHPAELRCEVDRYWHELKAQFKHREFIEDEKQGWCGIGVVFVDGAEKQMEKGTSKSASAAQ